MIDDDRLLKPPAALGRIYGGIIGTLEDQRRQAPRQSTARLQRQAALLRREAERLEKRLGPDHPDVIAIAAAYYNSPESADRWTEDGWSRTGDVATIDAEGYIQIMDRIKDVIKSGGEWVSSIDLENMIVGHPKVLEAAVIGVPHRQWMERPLACVVPRPEHRARLTPDEILDFLRPQVAKFCSRTRSSSSTRSRRPASASSTRRCCASASRTGSRPIRPSWPTPSGNITGRRAP